MSALSACLERGDGAELPQASVALEDLPERQHAWNEYLERDGHGNHVAPEHHVLLALEYVGEEPTDETDRDELEAAFETLERAFERGNDGLVFTVGYGPAYFERFDDALPGGVDLPPPEPMAAFEDPVLDEYDALVHLASDHGSAVLSAEEALTGGLSELNGLAVEGSLEGVFTVADRRTGFIGQGLPAERQEEVPAIEREEPVPEDAPMFMGFESGFRRNQASEDRVTIREGPFADGTTTHLSRIRLDLRQWYLQDSREQRVSKMFCPAHAAEGRVEGAGHNLGDDAGVDGCAETLEEDARSGVVGHSQKLVRAREDDDPLLLRRDVSSTDDGEAGVHFLSHQREVGEFAAVREAMNGSGLSSAIGTRTNNGILQYLEVTRRANFLVPPRRHRSLPEPDPG
ncbi:Tat pathway signal protein [Natronobiforma cellulositropha]